MTVAWAVRSVAGDNIVLTKEEAVPTIVIGSDGSAQSDAALRFGGVLARATGAGVFVATAYLNSPPLRGDRGSYDAIMHEDALEIARKGAASLAGVVDARAIAVGGGTLQEALHHVAETEDADLLVVATSGRRRIAGHQPGSMAERVVHHSPCPVAVVPPRDGEPRFKRIGVAVDGTPAARAALAYAYRLADEAAGERPDIDLVHVKPQFAQVPQPGLTPPDPDRVLAREQLEAMAAEAAIHGDVQIVEPLGDPADELVAISEGLDVLVTGSRDQGALKRLVLGSVSTHVVRHARCPVVVVPVGTRAGEAGSVSVSPETAGA
jgi:nucleotide-binding universal stress UspA family protein